MKLADYLPEVPQLAQTMINMNEQINFLELMKARGESGQAPTIGLDHVVNTWVRHQMAYRQQLVMDLQMLAMSVEEIRAPLHHITEEVFRRGIEWVPLVENPDVAQKEAFNAFLDDCNIFDQSLEEVLKQFHFDVNCIDDAFLYIVKEYTTLDGRTVKAKPKEIRRLNPALIEFDLDAAGLPKNAHFMCPIHREKVLEEPGRCKEEKCRIDTHPVMYKYYHRNQHIFLFDNEVVHISKFSPSETYGWSPILTIFEKALTLIGMDKNLYRYFYERKMPASMMMVFTDDPESLRRERQHIAAQTRLDPNYIPMVAVSSRQNRGRVDMVRLYHTLQEMDYLPVRAEIRERIAAICGVTPAWQGAPEAFGGLSTQTQQLVVMSRIVEGDQRLFHEKVFAKLLKAFGVTDWGLKLPNPEEKAEATRISFAQQRAQVVNQYIALGFDVRLKDDGVNLDEAEFLVFGKPVPTAQMQGEQMAMGLEQQQQQMEMMQQQQQQMQQMPQMPEGGPPGVNQAPGRVASAPAGGEGGGASPAPAVPLQNMADLFLKDAKKFGGRFAGRTPDWHEKSPFDEDDVDAIADVRAEKAEAKGWMQDLFEKGYTAPLIKEVNGAGTKMWFIQNGIDFVADLNPLGVTHVEKASFSGEYQGPVFGKPKGPSEKPVISYNPSDQEEEPDDRRDNANF